MPDLENNIESVTVSMSRKINLGNYENEDVFASITLRKNDDPKVTREMLFEYGWKWVRHEMKNKVKELKGE